MSSSFDKVLASAQSWVGEIEGVVAVGQGDQNGEPSIDVWVTAVADRARIPTELEGFRVAIRDSGGEVFAQQGWVDPPR